MYVPAIIASHEAHSLSTNPLISSVIVAGVDPLQQSHGSLSVTQLHGYQQPSAAGGPSSPPPSVPLRNVQALHVPALAARGISRPFHRPVTVNVHGDNARGDAVSEFLGSRSGSGNVPNTNRQQSLGFLMLPHRTCHRRSR